jgi:hypothetical protein
MVASVPDLDQEIREIRSLARRAAHETVLVPGSWGNSQYWLLAVSSDERINGSSESRTPDVVSSSMRRRGL